MSRDTLRQLEDEEIRTKQAICDGKTVLGLTTYIWVIRVLIKQQKEINDLKEKLNERTNVGL